MTTPTGPTSLVPSTTSYRDHFTRSDTNTFCGSYTGVLGMYSINPDAAITSTTPADIAQLIYAMAQ